MKIKYHYVLSVNNRLIKFLEKYDVSYEISRLPDNANSICTFDLYEDQEHYSQFRSEFPFNKAITKSIEYSKREIANAEWLFLRSKSKKVEWRYRATAFELSCEYKKLFHQDKYYKHSLQVKPLTVVKPMKWNTRLYFSGPNAADDFIFCSATAKHKLEGRWKGLYLGNVVNQKNEPYENLYQLVFERELPFEGLYGGIRAKCRTCGRPYIRLKEPLLQLSIDRRFMSDTESVYTTGTVLADCITGFPTYSLNIVPHSFYQVCEENHMNHGMIYEPINLV